MQRHQEFSTPQKKCETPVYKPYIRKFPGPAGLAPDLAPGEVEKLLLQESGLTGISNNAVLLSSKYSNLLLSKPCYRQLIRDFGLNKLNNPLNHLTLEMVSKAFCRKAKRDLKVPFLGLLVSSVSQEHGIALKLMDPTFEVNAVVHQELWDEIRETVKLNSVLALTQVPVIASFTVRPPITLYISKKNLVFIYTEGKEGETEVKPVNRVPESDLRRSCLEWLTQMGMNGRAGLQPEVPSSSGRKSNSGSGIRAVEKSESNRGEFLVAGLNLTEEDFVNPPAKVEARQEFGKNWKRAKLEMESDKLIGGKREGELDFSEIQRDFASAGGQRTAGELAPTQIQELSPREKMMVQEVLNGINFEDFES